LWLVWLGMHDRLTANPIEFITRATGDWTLYFLCFTLAITPLRRLTGQNSLLRLRRMLGLFTFFYACLHFLTFLWFDHFFDLADMVRDILKRPFIAMGFSAFVLLVPLALTSNDVMVRKLGRRWMVLHRLIYVIAVFSMLHFWWMRAGKNNFAEPLIMGAIVAVLLVLRLIRARRDSSRTR
jgi:sulfoxide reductase heme-binding subunit YedZ